MINRQFKINEAILETITTLNNRNRQVTQVLKQLQYRLDEVQDFIIYQRERNETQDEQPTPSSPS